MKLGMKFARVFFTVCFSFILLLFAQKSIAYKLSKVMIVKEPVYEYIPAEVISNKSVIVSSKIPGFVRGLRVDVGSVAKKGEVLLYIEKKTMQQSIKQAKENVLKAKAQLENARFNYNKFKVLYSQKVISRQQFLSMKTNYEMAKSAYQQALSALSVAKSNLKYSVIKSPINGVVAVKFVNNGDMAAMFQPLLKISAPGSLQVEAGISAELLKYAKKDGAVKVKIGNKVETIKLTNISPSSDPASRTFLIKAYLPKRMHAKPGEFAYLIIKKGYKSTLVVNREAITTRGEIDGVFVVDKNNRAHFRMVRLGESYGKYVEILSGIFSGEKVVLNPPLSLTNRSIITDETQ